MNTFRRICAWCNADMGPAPAGSKSDTHGICKKCAKDMK